MLITWDVKSVVGPKTTTTLQHAATTFSKLSCRREHRQNVLPKGRFFTVTSGTKVAVLLKGRSSTANSGTQAAVLQGMDWCGSSPLLLMVVVLSKLSGTPLQVGIFFLTNCGGGSGVTVLYTTAHRKVTHTHFFLDSYCSWNVQISSRYSLKFSLQITLTHWHYGTRRFMAAWT